MPAGFGIMDGARERVTREPRTQEVSAPMPRYSSTAERFFAKVRFTDSCWLWTASTVRGYGCFSHNDIIIRAHRYAYEFCVGPIPDGLTLDHLCRVRHCVNSDHLEPVTLRENILRSPIGVTAINARKTHCSHGHEFTAENTRIESGGRRCKTCRSERRKEEANS